MSPMAKSSDTGRQTASSVAKSGDKTSQVPPKSSPKRAPSATTTRYLLVYNTASFALWSTLTGRLLLLLLLLGPSGHISPVYDALAPLLRTTQSLALLEVVHAVLGLVRASPVTTAMQVASRIVVVWGVMWMFSKQAVGKTGILGGGGSTSRVQGGERGDWAFVGCLIAWGITECVRYGFFVLQLLGNGVPKFLLWLRYVYARRGVPGFSPCAWISTSY